MARIQDKSGGYPESYRVVRDLESGTYLKVHNHLGRGHRVHKDGSPLTKFVPGVSGCRNHHSGDYNTLAGGRYESWLEGNIPSRVKEKTDNPSPSNTLDRRRNDNKSEQKSAVHPSLSFTSSLSLRIKSKNSVRGPQHYAKLVELEQNDKQLEPGTLKEVLKAYHEMIEEKEAENFSLKKEEIPGSVRLQKPQERTVLASKYFSNKASYESLSPSPAQTLPLRLSKKKLQALPESFSLKRQYLHDRHLYFSMHPQRRLREKSIDQDRRTNLKKLESDSIRQNEAKSNKIYETIPN